jgi:hypothetical protein
MYSTDWTAALTLHTVLPVNQSTGNAGLYASVPAGTYFAFLFRDPLRAIVTFVANPTTKTYSYASKHYNAITNAITASVPILAASGSPQPINFLYCVDSYIGNSAYLHPHGNNLYAGTVDGQPFVWCDMTVVVAFAQLVSDTGAYVEILLFDGQVGTVIARTAAFSSSSTSFTTLQAGYYSFVYVVGTYNATQTASFTITASSDCFGHLAVPYADSHLLDLVRVRVLAGSLLMSNVASKLNQEGSMYLAQFQTSKLWWENLSPAAIAVARNSYVGPMEKGAYAFLKPASAKDFEYVAATVVNNGIVSSAGYDLTTTLEYVAVSSVCVSVGSAYPGLDALLTYVHAIEFVTDDQFFEAELPMYTTAQVQTAMEEVSTLPQFYENFTHMAVIASMLAKGAAFLLRNATTIGSMVNTILSNGQNVFEKTPKRVKTPRKKQPKAKPKPKTIVLVKRKPKRQVSNRKKQVVKRKGRK